MGRAAKRRTVPRQMPSPQVITIINSLTEPSALPPPEIRVEEAEKARRKYFSKVTLSHREKSDAPEHSDRPPRRSEDILRGASGGILCEGGNISRSRIECNFAYSLEEIILSRLVSLLEIWPKKQNSISNKHLDILRVDQRR